MSARPGCSTSSPETSWTSRRPTSPSLTSSTRSSFFSRGMMWSVLFPAWWMASSHRSVRSSLPHSSGTWFKKLRSLSFLVMYPKFLATITVSRVCRVPL
ncbi:hypothetical protein FR483_n556R [Paramecium bursaria Chlorella virus FR483]|uniref:Uncharacterized protein n556R n=1 Tax=Paramecium bursaria Chlorella virus FR483 TaxID=399781 RepID=A7J7R0_PBCVF|nr:hypothetical protein FR483_n556R [Paramecium bursaria Chlorella virus FR483]ABT15841.1 hypothetical protein FR483_n556R [Paramecium bursaria Chlorella virus FR483]